MRKSAMSLAPALVGALLAACGDDSNDGPAKELPFIGTPLATAENTELKLELYTKGPLEVGRNEVAYRLSDKANTEVINRATLTQKPMMAMMDHSHACPLTNPPQDADADGRFLGTLIPNMPGGNMGTWTLDVDVLLDGQSTAQTLSFGELQVSERAIPARKDLVVGEDKYIITLNFLAGTPQVGSNDIIVTVHKVMQMGMMFPPQTDLTIEMTPEMPTMGHGSHGNEDPVHVANGEYDGLVVFNMAGAWRITFVLSRAGTSIGQVVYDFTI